jgi:hypothetical protein
LSSSSVPRDLLPDIQTEEDLQAIFEANYVSTDNTYTDTAISETEHNTDTETETDAKSLYPLLWKQGIVCRGIFRRHIKNFIVKICLGYPLAS